MQHRTARRGQQRVSLGSAPHVVGEHRALWNHFPVLRLGRGEAGLHQPRTDAAPTLRLRHQRMGEGDGAFPEHVVGIRHRALELDFQAPAARIVVHRHAGRLVGTGSGAGRLAHAGDETATARNLQSVGGGFNARRLMPCAPRVTL
jgi:hypothetical protein